MQLRLMKKETHWSLQRTVDMKKLVIWILAVAAVCACSPDLGNYTYSDLTEPGISGLEDCSVLTFSDLSISPSFNEGFDESLYTFEWKVVNRNGSGEQAVIGLQRNLDYNVALSPGSYSLFFTVTQKDSGIYWQKEVILTVNSSTSQGWMVLCSDDSRARLDFVSDVTGQISRDVLSGSGMPVMHGPRKIQWLSDKTDAASPYYLLTDDGATRLGRDAFEWKPEYDFSYEVAVQEKLVPHSIVSAGFGKVAVSEGKAYYCEVMGFDGLYGSAVNKDFSVSEYVGANVLATQVYAAVYLLYDEDNGRMMAFCPLLSSGDLGSLEPLSGMDEFRNIADGMNPGAGVLGDAFDEWPVGYDCLYMENTRYDPGNARMGITYLLLTDGASCHLYGVQLGDILCYADCTYVLGKGYYGDLSGCRDILKDGNLFAFSSLKNCMYYSIGGDVYRVDLSADILKEELQLSLPGEEITCLKFNLYQKTENIHKSYDLIVGSVTQDGEGILRIYDGRQSDGDFTSVDPVQYRGFAPIEDVTYKESVY